MAASAAVQERAVEGIEITPLTDFGELSDSLSGLADLVLAIDGVATIHQLKAAVTEAVQFASYTRARLDAAGS